MPCLDHQRSVAIRHRRHQQSVAPASSHPLLPLAGTVPALGARRLRQIDDAQDVAWVSELGDLHGAHTYSYVVSLCGGPSRLRYGTHYRSCVLLRNPLFWFHAENQFRGHELLDRSIAHIVGEWWSLLIVRDAFLGVTKFDDFQARLAISRNILTQRLNHLVDNEILQRVPYQDHPPRHEYRLTEKGRDLAHVVTAIREWGDRWVAPDGPPLKLRHNKCGRVAKSVTVCSHCGERLDLEDVTAFPGPGSVPGDYDRTRLEGLSTKKRVARRR